MKIHEIRKISRSDLRNLCIEKDWYTRGDNEEYGKLLDMCEKEMDVLTLVAVARDIIEHSNPKRFADFSEDRIAMEYVLYELAEISHSVFHVI